MFDLILGLLGIERTITVEGVTFKTKEWSEIISFIRKGEKIAAIKAIRLATGWSLKETVHWLRDNHYQF